MVRCTPDTANSNSNGFDFVSGASEKALLVSPPPHKIAAFQPNEKTQNSVAKFEGEQSHA